MLPLVAYAFFGNSSQLITGPSAAGCALVAAAIAPLRGGDEAFDQTRSFTSLQQAVYAFREETHAASPEDASADAPSLAARGRRPSVRRRRPARMLEIRGAPAVICIRLHEAPRDASALPLALCCRFNGHFDTAVDSSRGACDVSELLKALRHLRRVRKRDAAAVRLESPAGCVQDDMEREGNMGFRCQWRSIRRVGHMPRVGVLALFVVIVGGCGGGGGGSSPSLTPTPTPTPTPPPPYQTLNPPSSDLSDLVGFGTNTSTNFATAAITQVAGGSVAGALTVANSAISSITLRVESVGGVTFQETFAAADFADVAVPSGWNAPPILTAQKTATDGSVRSFGYIDPAKLGFVYSTLGGWSYSASAGATSVTNGYFSLGIPTRAADLPTTGTASYSGVMIGSHANGSAVVPVSATAAATADFAARSVSLGTTNTVRNVGGVAVAAPQLNLNGTLTYPAGVSSLSGTATTQSGMSGPANAGFYGPGAAELGGSFFVGNTSEQMSGAFGLKKQ